ncbi:deazaflavin-dependent oxidoreductase (nitroreductase family) [Actinoplanes octamycinicus]|uniref:Deazaflavin-dependent oxidoreductase (Nitroreductase family) n=1 Tax=Actinoplanes octamycinicus TaxID=135948 RepID=A0A7W7MB44_9ACTN|nr:nitroreductase/quinone reductase family protein [Actinoplanes octamycinicus]MBB4743475.1 deazaflavin-dependent oxidoreductase (nitroreductase family) [Actinoplanes octamycinicus]GIE62540.1 hypothetical protein Aoc01nite_79420 [Actinoplanes octamycinicus]
MSDAELPKTLRFQGFANLVVRGLLRTPLIANAVGARLVVLYVVGRKSGKHYEVPVAYTRHDGQLLIGTPFGWARNLRTGEPVEVRYKGRRRVAAVEVRTAESEVVADYALIARDNAQFARFNNIGLDARGTPDPAALHRAWAAGARVIRLTL